MAIASGDWWRLDDAGTLRIFCDGDMPEAEWTAYKDEVRTVIISDGVTNIRDSVFREYANLTGVVIPDSVISIGDSAFYNCSNLTGINIPDSVVNIADYAFYGCSSITGIVIPKGVTNIGYAVFYGCSGLTDIIIPDGVTGIGDYAFNRCSGLKSVIMPSGVASIGIYAFYRCGGLTNIVIPDGVVKIASGAFAECSDLTSVTLPDSVMNIESSAFRDCPNLVSINIPSGVTSIPNYAFYRCSGLTGVAINGDITSVGYAAFYGCGNLTDVYYSKSEIQWKKIFIDEFNNPLVNATIDYGIPTYTVTFSLNDGAIIGTQRIERGATATRPENPVKNRYDFSHWALNGGAYDFNQPVVDNIILTAIWKLSPDSRNIFMRRDKILSVIIPRGEEIGLIVKRPPVGKIILGTRTRRNYMDIGEMPEIRVNLSAEADIVRGRYRLLRELDNKAIASIDGLTLGDLDYVFID